MILHNRQKLFFSCTGQFWDLGLRAVWIFINVSDQWKENIQNTFKEFILLQLSICVCRFQFQYIHLQAVYQNVKNFSKTCLQQMLHDLYLCVFMSFVSTNSNKHDENVFFLLLTAFSDFWSDRKISKIPSVKSVNKVKQES